MIMKIFYSFWFGLFWSMTSFATHNRGGEITYRQIGWLTYEATIITYTKASSTNASRDTLNLDWGDGTTEKVLRTNGPGSPPQGQILGNDIIFNVYQSGFHTYPVPCDYVVSVTDPNRTGSIININVGASINLRFYIESLIRTKDPTFCKDQSSFFIGPPIFYGNVNHAYVHNLAAANPDGDSLAFELVVPLQGKGFPVPNYQSPELITTGILQSFSINSRTGEIIWEFPKQLGIYCVAVKIHEWKNGFYSGFITRDFEIIVEDDSLPTMTFDGLQSWPTDMFG